MSRPQSVESTATHPRDALITISPVGQLELRQNNPQDCSNLIIASVDRATVEISRTIIALNATFSQQLDQARISASNGIKSAQDSATSTILVVVQSANIATSSAFSSVRVANLAVTSANVALTSATDALSTANLALNSALSASTSVNIALSTANSALTSALSASTSVNVALSTANSALTSALSASSSDVSSLSSRLRLVEASLAAAQGGLTSFSNTQGQPSIVLSLSPAQIAGIVVGAVVASILFGVVAGFVFIRMKKSRRSTPIDEKIGPQSSGDPPSRPASSFQGDEKGTKRSPPSVNITENPFMSPEELTSPHIDTLLPDLDKRGQLHFNLDNQASFVAPNEALKSEAIPIASIEAKPRRNFSLPRNKETRKRLSPKTPNLELQSQAGEEDWTDIAEARKQAIEGAAQEPPAYIFEQAAEPTRNLSGPDLAAELVEKTEANRGTEQSVSVIDPTLEAAERNLRQDAATGHENPFEGTHSIENTLLDERSREAGRRHVSPLRRNPVLIVAGDDEPIPPLPSLPNKQRAISPLRRNPVIQPPAAKEPLPPPPPVQSPPDKHRAVSPLRRNPVFQTLEEEEPVPPLPLPFQLEEQRPTSPTRRDLFEGSPMGREHSPLTHQTSSLLRSDASTKSHDDSEPASPFEQAPALPTPQEEQLSPSEANLPLLNEDESEISASEEIREVSPSQPHLSSLSIESLIEELESVVKLEEPEYIEEQGSFSEPSEPDESEEEVEENIEEQEDEQPHEQLYDHSEDHSEDQSEDHSEDYTEDQTDEHSGEHPEEYPEEYSEEHPEEHSDEHSDEEPEERPDEVPDEIPDEVTDEIPDEEPDEETVEESDEEPDNTEEALEVDERVIRGRSMIRTSDIIEARLSAMARARVEVDEMPVIMMRQQEAEVDSPESSTVTSPDGSPGPAQVDRTESPLRRNPIIIRPPQDTTQEISLASLKATPLERDESPLRRNPPIILKSNPLTLDSSMLRPKSKPTPTNLLRPAQAQLKTGGNAQFSQAFLMFKSLDSKNSQKAAAATNEVNHRALAGIYVPASLREQAVRNLSKSRERGKSRARDVGS